MIHQHPRILFALTATAGLGGCDALTGDDYRGEALFSLEGVIDNHRTSVPRDVNIYLLWARTVDTPNTPVKLDIKGTFPATFRLNVFTPPPIDPDFGFPEPWSPNYARLTFAHIIAATSDAEFRDYLMYPWDHHSPGILGADPRHFIYYMPEGVIEDSTTAYAFHSTFTPGFHVIDIKCVSPAKQAEIQACLNRFHPEGVPNDSKDLKEIYKVCGSPLATIPWLLPAPDDLQTELTVELFDDLATYKPDPAECL